MDRIRRSQAWPATVVVALAAGPGPMLAQVDTRLDYRVDQSGAADASNLVGSGGRNALVPTYVANSANLYITGNVTAGRSFRAFSPISDPSSFALSLPSSALDSFRRDSVSLENVLAGRNAAVTAPYYSRQQTTTSLGTLSAGFDRPGAWPSGGVYSIPASTPAYTMPRFGIPYAEQLAQPLPSASMQAGQLALPVSETSPFLEALPTSAVYGAEAAPWFGLTAARATRLPGLAPLPLPLFAADQEPPSFDVVAFPESVDQVARSARLTEERVSGSPEGALWESAGFVERLLLAEPTAAPQAAQQPAAVTPGATSPEQPSRQEPAARSLAPPGQELPRFGPGGTNLYLDMVQAYQFVTREQQSGPEFRTAIAASPTAGQRYQRDVSAARRMLTEPITTFAGSGEDVVQDSIRQAEQLVREGKYYQAKARYEYALIFDRSNPMALIGLGHAMLAAGEYYSAALTLSRAIELFPAVAYFRLDLRTFITEPDLLEKRRADLEVRLEQREDYRYRFLLGYTEYYSELAKYGLPSLKRAAEQAPEHSGIARFHDLLTSHRPANDG